MTRYGLAIKALPKNGKPPFGDDEDQGQDTAVADGTATSAPPGSSVPDSGPATDGLANEVPDAETDADSAEGTLAGDDHATEGESSEEAPPAAEDDARAWSGDMYEEGDETDPADAFAAYEGRDGEEAWLDQAHDGTLTGWVRDATGQVWRYPDPDVWAIDVDDAHMTRTHSHPQDGDEGDPPAEHGGQDPLFPPQS